MRTRRALNIGDFGHRRASAGVLACALLGILSSCGQEAPEEPVTTDPASYYPLVEGAWWRYAHSDWTERVDLEATTFNGQEAFLMVDSPNPSDDVRSDSIIANVGGRAARLTKEEYLVGAGEETLMASVTYGVGFTRFNEDWANQAVGYQETPEYVRVETPAGGTPRAPEDRRHTFEVVSLSEEVRTGAGVFDCIVIQRRRDWQAEEDGLDAEDAETKTYWFARGVGKVQERNDDSGNTEVLLEYFIPDTNG